MRKLVVPVNMYSLPDATFAEYKYTKIATLNAKTAPNDILPTLKKNFVAVIF